MAANHPRVGLIGMGDMGAAIAKSLGQHGVSVATTAEGRSATYRQRAEASGVRLLPSLTDLLHDSELVLCVVPPAAAERVAQEVAGHVKQNGSNRQFVYADCNAISPMLVARLASVVEGAGAAFADGGIIGPPPGVGRPRLYVSGARADSLLALDDMGWAVRRLDGPVGRASALKMLFSGLNKGFNALSATALIAAESLQLGDALEAEVETMIPALGKRMAQQMPYLPVNAPRWIAEMQEIGDLMAELGLPRAFHDGAADLFGLMARRFGENETRETFDSSRTARDVARKCARPADR